ncbi:MAG: hypothetical protein QOG21_481 [Actinomycetota bacterium]|nr:hypothetical protein [Actinomycetota bacterium]
MESSDGEMTDQDAGFDEDPERDPGEQLEAVMEQADHALGSESFGTTAEEESRGESLDQRLAQERQGQAPTDTALVIEDSGEPDEESEMVADASLEQDSFLAPEEAAVHVVDEDKLRDS